MTKQHPLTDKLIDKIQMKCDGPCFQCYDDMRASYDKGFNDAIEFIYSQGLATHSSLCEAQERFYNQQEEN